VRLEKIAFFLLKFAIFDLNLPVFLLKFAILRLNLSILGLEFLIFAEICSKSLKFAQNHSILLKFAQNAPKCSKIAQICSKLLQLCSFSYETPPFSYENPQLGPRSARVRPGRAVPRRVRACGQHGVPGGAFLVFLRGKYWIFGCFLIEKWCFSGVFDALGSKNGAEWAKNGGKRWSFDLGMSFSRNVHFRVNMACQEVRFWCFRGVFDGFLGVF
jgi:hypothetical protein